MAMRFDDRDRVLQLSVRDLVEGGAGPALGYVQTRAARAAAGQRVHQERAAARSAELAVYRPEVSVKRTFAVGAWTVMLWGRVDGVEAHEDHTVVEEVKSTALDARRLFPTTAADWPAWREQLAIYLWMLAEADWPAPVGRLVLVSLVDGAQHVLGVALDRDGVGRDVVARLQRLCDDRERRIAWMERRRAAVVPLPHEAWRPGQREIAEAVEWGVEAGHPVLIEAPTGLGKTDAALVGVLRLALRTDKQVFWATARTTQQEGVARAVERLRARGLSVRSTTIHAQPKLCDRSCRARGPCARREEHPIRREAHDQPFVLASRERHVGASDLRAEADRCALCPSELGLDLTGQVDVVIGDYNYVFDPGMFLRRHFADEAAAGWIVVVDEAHQLAERVREALSPGIEARLAREATAWLWTAGAEFAPFVALAEAAERLVMAAAAAPGGRVVGDHATTELPGEELRGLARRVDAVGLDYALLTADRATPDPDPWLVLARQVLLLAGALDEEVPPERAGDRVPTVRRAEGNERLGLLCLDPSGWLGPRLAALGGFVGLSATLSPSEFHRDLLGLPADKLDVVSLPSPFPRENRAVVVASRVSTAYRDREEHAAPTAALLSACLAAVPGNAAVYFPSFAMLDDLVGRMDFAGRELVAQRPGMDDALRAVALERMGDRRGAVLCAVLGGVFAEGVDLPPGSLDAVFVVSPALPPVGLERELLREHYERRFGQGFRYASLVPGTTRVVQAAGRLHRRPEDRGVIVLVDRRFRWRDVRSLLPADWDPEVAVDPVERIRRFFAD